MYLRGNLRVRLATQRKSLRKINLRPQATTCNSVWLAALRLILQRITDIDLLQDRHADGHMTPQIDSHQDYELISLVESGGKTTMKFKRKFKSCDPDDNAIQVNVFPCYRFIGETTKLNMNCEAVNEDPA